MKVSPSMQTAIPLSIGPLHFIGVGGIGMSGIAEILHSLGYHVQGSDLADNANTKRLRAKGVFVALGHCPENLGSASVIVYSSAISADNPELREAAARGLPRVRRAEMLGELMRMKWAIAIAGAHGKTTTTSLVGALLDAGGLDPTVINGGIVNAYGTNVRLGTGPWMVAETDESDGSFTSLPATVAVVTNIDREHLSFYGDFDALRSAFDRFVANIPFYGFAVLCLDNPEVQAMVGRQNNRRIITYGFSPQAEIRACEVEADGEGMRFDVILSSLANDGEPFSIKGIRLPMIGAFNVRNALAAIAVAHQLGVTPEKMREALARFSGVGRRFTLVGTGAGVRVIDDYGHHPVEIASVLEAARQGATGRIIAIVQPHRYSRVQELFDDFCTCFNDADVVLVCDIYKAGEEPIPGIDRDALVEGLRKHGHRAVHPVADPSDLAELVYEHAQPGDMAICLGAGSISQWSSTLPGKLAKLEARRCPPQGRTA